MIKKFTIWILALSISMSFMPTAFAENEEDTECGKGFISFLSTVIDLQDFSVYWYDIFTKNMCEIEDIFALEDELDSIREAIREKYYACDYQGLSEMRTQYKAKRMELYFVRNAASSALESMTSSEIGTLSANIPLYLENLLYDEMYGEFVVEKEWFLWEDFDAYFTSFVDEYTDNTENYLTGTCGWSGVVEKWNHIDKTVDGIIEAFSPEEDDEEKTPAEPEAKDAPKNGEEGFFKKHFDFLFEPTTNLTGAIESGTGSADGTTSGSNIVDSFDTYVDMLDTYDTEFTEAQLLDKYKALYSEGGAEISSALSASLQQLEGILTISAKTDIPNAKKLVHKIAKKQCRN